MISLCGGASVVTLAPSLCHTLLLCHHGPDDIIRFCQHNQTLFETVLKAVFSDSPPTGSGSTSTEITAGQKASCDELEYGTDRGRKPGNGRVWSVTCGGNTVGRKASRPAGQSLRTAVRDHSSREIPSSTSPEPQPTPPTSDQILSSPIDRPRGAPPQPPTPSCDQPGASQPLGQGNGAV